MREEKPYHAGYRTGRPREGKELQIYIYVESGIRVTGLSVNAFCKKYPLFGIVENHWGRRKAETMNGNTMRRTYVRTKKQSQQPATPFQITAPSPHADAMEKFVQQHVNYLRSQA